MTTLTVTKLHLPSAKMNGESSLPPFSGYQPGKRSGDFGTDEYAGLWIDYGLVPSAFPYRTQDMYTRELYPTDEDVVVLENDHLKATFMPHYGGKLWSLYDKDQGKDLLYTNSVIRPCNLATRNAWMSGGVEWNCGIFGHHVHTCDTLHTARLTMADGTPVLRFYSYERIRRAVIQMDFFLPEGSHFLFTRMRVTNTTNEVIPMYWWSNIAVVEDPKARVVTWANGAYTNDGNVSEVPIPIHRDIDVSYPSNIPSAIDYFYNIPERKRKFEAMIGEDGTGFVQTSTSRLIGRKLFVWGTGAGGDHWKNYLTADDEDGAYVELQAGLCHSQYESMPMPPATTWEWMEAYGAIKADPAKIHGEWKDAQVEADRALSGLLPEDTLEDMLISTREMALTKADEVIFRGDGWAALENMRRAKEKQRLMAPHLDFGEVGEDQAAWVKLMNERHMPEPSPDDVPPSYMLQPEWTAMMEKSCATSDRYNWYAHYQLAMTYCAMRDWAKASAELEKSMTLKQSAWGYYARCRIEFERGNVNEGAILALRASQMKPNDVSLAKEAIQHLVCLNMNDLALNHLATLPEDIQRNTRVRLYALFANVRLGNFDEAERILWQDGGLVVADIREGETLQTEMWFQIEEGKAKREGREFNRAEAEVPEIFDFRADGPKRKKKGK